MDSIPDSTTDDPIRKKLVGRHFKKLKTELQPFLCYGVQNQGRQAHKFQAGNRHEEHGEKSHRRKSRSPERTHNSASS